MVRLYDSFHNGISFPHSGSLSQFEAFKVEFPLFQKSENPS